MTTFNSIEKSQRLSAIAATDSAQSRLDSEKQKDISKVLLNESDKYSADAQSKEEKAREHAALADQLEKKAKDIERLARTFSNGDVNLEAMQTVQAVKLIAEQHGVTDIPIPKDASPAVVFEYLNELAKRLHALAYEHRKKADDLLRESEESSSLSKQLKEQSRQIEQKDNFSDLQLQSVVSRNEKLKMVLIKLGIYDLDQRYKTDLASLKKKAEESAQGG